MSTKNDGGPAFPIGSTPEEWGNGMTLRDYFAAKAMQAWLSDTKAEFYDPKMQEAAAKYGYMIADQMLKARLK